MTVHKFQKKHKRPGRPRRTDECAICGHQQQDHVPAAKAPEKPQEALRKLLSTEDDPEPTTQNEEPPEPLTDDFYAEHGFTEDW